jgi:DNA-binding MarR family transcriptional regulator
MSTAKKTPGRPRARPAAQAQPLPTPEHIDTRFLETLVGYNARRAALAVIEVFLRQMAPYDMRPVDFSVASLIARNPGITSRQLCATLGILPPNLVGLIKQLEARGLITRQPHASDRRATGLHPTRQGSALITKAEATAQALELEATHALSPSERKTLIALLQKVYVKPA